MNDFRIRISQHHVLCSKDSAFIAWQASSYVGYVSIDGLMLYIARIDLNEIGSELGIPSEQDQSAHRNSSKHQVAKH